MLIPLGSFHDNGRSQLALLARQFLPGVVIEKSDVVPALLQLLNGSSSCLGSIMNANRDCRVDFRSCDLLEQLCALALGSQQEGIELSLCEEDRSPELIECEICSRLHSLANLSLASRYGAAVIKPV